MLDASLFVNALTEGVVANLAAGKRFPEDAGKEVYSFGSTVWSVISGYGLNNITIWSKLYSSGGSFGTNYLFRNRLRSS